VIQVRFTTYTPLETQALFKEIGKLGLKHSGDYGQFGFGFLQWSRR
jgi:hypothetical protein